MSSSHLETQFLQLWEYYYPSLLLVREHKFYPKRKFRFDFAHIDSRVAIETHGGIYTGGYHVRVGGFRSDCTKYCLAASIDWLVFPLTDKMIDKDWCDAIAATILKRSNTHADT